MQVEILAPRVVLALKEKEIGVLVAVIPLGPQVIEHGVEDHRQSALMAGVNEGAKFVRRAVAVVRRKEQHAIVTPAAPAGPIRHGHELQRRHSEFHHVIECLNRGKIGPLFRHGADVAFVDDLTVEGGAFPSRGLPRKGSRIDNHGRAIYPAWLEMRGKIGDGRRVIQGEPIEIALRPSPIEAEEITVRSRFELERVGIAPGLLDVGDDLFVTEGPHAVEDALRCGHGTDVAGKGIDQGGAHGVTGSDAMAWALAPRCSAGPTLGERLRAVLIRPTCVKA